MNILAIDVGLYHLAMVGIGLNLDYLSRDDVILDSEITLCDLIDITELITECDYEKCELFHDKNICDYMMHLFKKFRNEFEKANRILIERQPPTGLIAVQELIMREYRSKSELVSPTAMLNFFGILHFKYEERKVHTEKIAMNYLDGIKVFVFNERRHDMADAFCILYYYLETKRREEKEKIEKQEKEQEFKKRFGNTITDLQKFIYVP